MKVILMFCLIFISGILSLYSTAEGLNKQNLSQSELSQQEIEMRKMVLEMVKTSMLQSCKGLQTQDCINLDESSCEEMMQDVVTKCIEPVINNPDFATEGTCSDLVMAQYGITEAAAERCGVDLQAEN